MSNYQEKLQTAKRATRRAASLFLLLFEVSIHPLKAAENLMNLFVQSLTNKMKHVFQAVSNNNQTLT